MSLYNGKVQRNFLAFAKVYAISTAEPP
jgi:hypothetical protein